MGQRRLQRKVANEADKQGQQQLVSDSLPPIHDSPPSSFSSLFSSTAVGLQVGREQFIKNFHFFIFPGPHRKIGASILCHSQWTICQVDCQLQGAAPGYLRPTFRTGHFAGPFREEVDPQ
jgi:hypothetical protein